MRKGQQSSNEKADYATAPALYPSRNFRRQPVTGDKLCCSYTVLGIGSVAMTLVWYTCFSLDKRSIAFGTNCARLYIALWFAYFSHEIRTVFLHGPGMWPRTLILRDADPQAKKSDFSPYMAVSTYTQILVCFFIVGFCCLAAIVGYYTKISIFVLWLHTRGFAFRNSGIQQAGDTLHRLLLFWMMFLPCHEFFDWLVLGEWDYWNCNIHTKPKYNELSDVWHVVTIGFDIPVHVDVQSKPEMVCRRQCNLLRSEQFSFCLSTCWKRHFVEVCTIFVSFYPN